MTAAQAPAKPVPQDEHEDLGGAVRHGLKWSFLNMAVGKAASILSGIALARILVPEDFGVYAPALAIVTILYGVNDLGLLLALVRWKGDLREAARTAQTLAFGFSCVLYVGCFAAAPWFARTMGSPDSAGVLRVLAVTVCIDGLTTVSHGLLVRGFHQDRFAKAEFAAMPVGIGTSLGLAVAGAGPWSFAIGQLAANCVSGAMTWRAAPFNVGFGFSWRIARPMLAYGVPLAGTSLVEYSLLNVDYLVVSRALDPVAVGLYLLAFNVSNWPLSVITDAVRRVSIAGFAKLGDDIDAVCRGFWRGLTTLLTVALPLLIALALLAEPVITSIYGDVWAPSAPVLQALVLLSGARVTIGFVSDLLVGVGRTRLTLMLQVVWLAVVVVALQIGVHVGEIRGVAVAHAAVAVGIALPLFLWRAARCVPVRPGQVLSPLLRPVVAAVVAAAAGLVVRERMDGGLLTVLVGGTTVVAVYAAVVVPRDQASTVLQRISSRTRHGRARPAHERGGRNVKTTGLATRARRMGAPLLDRRTQRIRAGVATGLRIGRAEASADYIAGTNELPVQVALADVLRPGAAFLDVGANVGFFSLLAARIVGPTGSVHAIEPVPANVARIRANARRNRLANVQVIEAAAAARIGEATLLLAVHPGGAVLASAGAPPDPAGRLVVATTTVDELVATGAIPVPDVVKIDVEGAEAEVLTGMTTTVARHRPIVLCEIDAGDDASLGAKRTALTATIEAAGYGVEVLERSYDGAWAVEHLLARPDGRS